LPKDPEKYTTFERVRKVIVGQLAVDVEKITEDSKLVDDLNADSLDLVEIVMGLEEEFNIEIPDEDAEKITGMRDAVEYIDSHKGRK